MIFPTDRTAASVRLPSNQKFGSFFCAFFFLLATWCFLISITIWAAVFAFVSTTFAVLTINNSQLLQPLNWLWYKVGMCLGRIVSPFVLGIIFFFIITPVSLVSRLFGRDELRIKKKGNSYWIDRSPPGPLSDSFKNQY